MKITLLDAMEALGVGGYCKNNEYDTIVWTKTEEAVSKEVLDAKVAELQAEYDSKRYQRDRLQEYPSIQECIHALLDGGDTLTELQAKRAEVKTKFPKPSE